MEELTDQALMLRYRDGDADAFEILYTRHKDALYRFVRRQCPVPAIAYDLVHDIWMKVIKARRQYRAEAKFTTYLFSVARHRLTDYYRAQARRIPTVSTEEQPVEVADIPEDRHPGPELRAHILDAVERSLELIQSLPPVQRETVLMYAEGLSMGEIAEITQVPADTARSRVRRALARVRAELRELAS